MTSQEILKNSQSNVKPAFLIDTIEELIKERDFMESNWNNSMKERMSIVSKISIIKFKKPLSLL